MIFALQDGLSLHLSSTYNVYMVVMVRYWFFAAFVMTVSAKQAGGLRNAARTKQPALQAFRGVLLAAEICVMVTGFTLLGMVESLAIFSAYTLIVAALSGPILGETVGWRRWLAIAVGFCGVLVILKPGFGVFSPYAIIPFFAAFMFALYSLLTRYVARLDSTATSFFWTGVMGCLLMSVIGAFHFENMSPSDWGLMLCLCSFAAMRWPRPAPYNPSPICNWCSAPPSAFWFLVRWCVRMWPSALFWLSLPDCSPSGAQEWPKAKPRAAKAAPGRLWGDGVTG